MLGFFRRYIKSATAKIFLLSVLGMLSSVCGVYMALISKSLVDVATLATDGSFLEEGMKLALVLVLQLGLNIWISSLHVRTQAGLKRSIQSKFFADLVHKSKLKISKMHSGELVNRLAGDIGFVAEGAAEVIPSALSIGTQIILSFAVLAFLDITLALICLALGPVMLLAAKLYRDKTSHLFTKSREAEGEVRSFLQESIQNLSVIKAFSAYDIINKQLKSRQDKSYKLTVRKNVVGIFANVCFFTAMTAGSYVALAWGAYRLRSGAIGFGTLTALITLSGELTSPFRALASLFQQYMSMRASVLRLEEIELFPGEESIGDVDTKKVYSSLTDITFDGVSFSYGDGFVLRDAEATFKKSEFTAVTGESGIGKSTVLGLLAGIYKQGGGEIFLNCDGKKYPLTEACATLFAYVPQDILILSGTIKENITFFSEQVDEERFLKAIRISCLYDEIMGMPDGPDTMLGENGSGLSGGQRQRIAIARALYSSAKILLLDEATSALSQEVEEQVLVNIKEEGYTAVVVTHRDSVIKLCDKVLIVKDAKIADSNYLKPALGEAAISRRE